MIIISCFKCLFILLMCSFYILYFAMPIVFSLEKYPDYNFGRVICTRILIITAKSLCVLWVVYIFYLFGWLSLILVIFAQWFWTIPVIVSLAALSLYHSFTPAAAAVFMILPMSYYFQAQEIISLHKKIQQKIRKGKMFRLIIVLILFFVPTAANAGLYDDIDEELLKSIGAGKTSAASQNTDYSNISDEELKIRMEVYDEMRKDEIYWKIQEIYEMQEEILRILRYGR